MRKMVGDGVDLVNYSWVDPYLKGLKYQEEIKTLEGEIEGLKRYPRAKSEILAELKLVGARVEDARVAGLRSVLRRYQDGEIGTLTPEVLAQVFVSPTLSVVSPSHTGAHAFEALLTEEVISQALAELPEGLSVTEKETKIAALREKIKKLKEKMERECWPDSRKYFNDKGQPLDGQDRWKEVVEHWRKVTEAYCKPVDLEGWALEQGSPAWEAFRKLGLTAYLKGSTSPPKRQK
jgi:uncharacterized small protein (DUF1192 family)